MNDSEFVMIVLSIALVAVLAFFGGFVAGSGSIDKVVFESCLLDRPIDYDKKFLLHCEVVK